jgi:hypothetical protein
MPRNNYPATVAEMIGPVVYRRETLAAVRDYARSKPWRGDGKAKMQSLHVRLCEIYGTRAELVFDPRRPACFIPALRRIVLPKVSVVSYLHEFAHARFGSCERRACRWSINLFRRCFPRSFARCRQVGHTLQRR